MKTTAAALAVVGLKTTSRYSVAGDVRIRIRCDQYVVHYCAILPLMHKILYFSNLHSFIIPPLGRCAPYAVKVA